MWNSAFGEGARRLGVSGPLWCGFVGWVVTWQAVEFTLRANRVGGPGYWVADVVVHTVLPLGIVVVALASRRLAPAELGFTSAVGRQRSRLRFAMLLAWAPVVGVATYVLAQWLARAVGMDRVPALIPSRAIYADLLPSRADAAARTLAIVYWSLSTGMVEELWFRAMLFRIVPSRWRHPLPYVLLSSVLFGLFHWWQGPSGILVATTFGSVMALAYYAFRSIWPVVIGHATVDALWLATLP